MFKRKKYYFVSFHFSYDQITDQKGSTSRHGFGNVLTECYKKDIFPIRRTEALIKSKYESFRNRKPDIVVINYKKISQKEYEKEL